MRAIHMEKIYVYYCVSFCYSVQLSSRLNFFLFLVAFRPEAFKLQTHDSSTQNLPGLGCEQETEETGSSDDDDGLPPLETNMNRRRPYELHAGSSSNSDADTDTDEES